MKDRPAFFEPIRERAEARWRQLEGDPDLAGPWHQLFKQVQSPRHVLSELLQNADDAGATEASIEISDGCLIFEHNGEDFTVDHFASLCRFGYSNKRDLHTIGFRGIGFKSTFSLGDTVELKTPTLSVAFDRNRFTAPRWTDTTCSDAGKTQVRVRIKDNNRLSDLEKNLAEWKSSPVSLLFFRKIRRLKIGEHDLRWNSVGPGPVDCSEWMELVDKSDERFLIIRSAEEEFPEDSLDEIRQERLLTPDQETDFPPCRVELVLGAAGRLYVVLPTGVETALPFACNAPFIQDPSRLKIKDPSTSPTNRWLLERIGRLASQAMLQWLDNHKIPVSDRCPSYGLIPDVDRGDNTLEGNCSSIVETAFDGQIDEKPFLLTSSGELKPSRSCVLYPEVLYEVWRTEKVVTLFDDDHRDPLCNEVTYHNRLKLIKRGFLEEIEIGDIIGVLKANHLPKTQSWDQLLLLWSYLAPTITDYWRRSEIGDLNIVPTQGKEVLCSGKEVVRLGEKRLLQSAADWIFLESYLLVANQNWTRYLSEQRRDSIANGDRQRQEKVENAFLILHHLGLDETSSHNDIIGRIAEKFFNQNNISLADCVRFAQVAAKLDVSVNESFRFATRDRKLRTKDVVFDVDGYLDLMFDEEWSNGHLLHPDYTLNFESCSQDEWHAWVNSGHSRLLGFVPLSNISRNIFGREQIRSELTKRGLLSEPHFPYVTNDFRIHDWDFESKYWSLWENLAVTDKIFWGNLLERILSQPANYWSEAKSSKIVQVATNRNTQTVTQSSLTPSWILKFRDLNCLRDTHGILRKPADLLLRTPETEPVIDVEPFVHASIDVGACRSLLRLLGVREKPTGPDHLLERLRALAKADNPPVHEVEKWYRRLDIMWDTCSTEDANKIRTAFQSEKLLFSERGIWSNTSGIFLAPDDEDVPGAEVIRSPVRDLTLWRKIGVAEHPTADLAIDWLKELESGSRILQDDTRRIKALQKRYPFRVWDECGHWLNLANEWVPIESLSYSITMQSLVAWSHLHEWVKQQTADLQNIGAEITTSQPFSHLKSLAAQIENRLNERSIDAEQSERKPWLNQLGVELSRVVLADKSETERVRILGLKLARSDWQIVRRLEVLPYIDGIPAGLSSSIDAVWLDEMVYVENRPLAKLAGAVSKAIGSIFDDPQINDAIKLCFDRSPKFVTEYMEENFKLATVASVESQVDEGSKQDAEIEETGNEAIGTGSVDTPEVGPERDEHGDERIDADWGDEEWESEDLDDWEYGDESEIKTRSRPPKLSIIERFAVSQGFNKDSDRRFYHSNGSWIGKTDDATFPWELRSASGVLLCYYWPKDHCLENKPLVIDTDAWRKVEKYPDLHSMILLDVHGEPVEMKGSKLCEMMNVGQIRLYPASYRLVFGRS